MAPPFLQSRNNMSIRRVITFGGLVTVLLLSGVAVAEEPPVPYVRIAELEIDPAQLESYKASVKEEMDASVRVEPGVLAIYAVAEKGNPCKLRFFEIYADEAAYKSHRETAHFKKYAETTKNMIKSRKLIETIPVQLSEKKK
jgi:quinol monooxygenase YgiN